MQEKNQNFFKKCFTNTQSCDKIYLADEATATKAWGISAVGSAQHWQCWGQEFESPMLHHKRTETLIQGFSPFLYVHADS